jgi:hypothetical protein
VSTNSSLMFSLYRFLAHTTAMISVQHELSYTDEIGTDNNNMDAVCAPACSLQLH